MRSELSAYLGRLGVEAEDPSPALLRRLHAAHLQAVPFENTGVLQGEAIQLDPEALVRKVAVAGRGGFCYELNGAFAELLRHLGFHVELLSCRVALDAETFGPPFDHLALRVWIRDEAWLADVGFGYCYLEPLRLVAGVVQDDPAGRFQLTEVDDSELEVRWDHGDGRFRPQYRLGLDPHPLDDFAEMCQHHATAPDSYFRQGWVCSIALEGGGVTLSHDRLITYRAGRRSERQISGTQDEAAILARWFGIER